MDKKERKKNLLDNLDLLGERYGGFWDTEHIPSFDLTQKHLLIYKEMYRNIWTVIKLLILKLKLMMN